MPSSWFKWMLIVAALLVASGNAHAFADHIGPKAEHCATAHQHQHHPGTEAHDECCCSCFNCPSGLMTPFEATSLQPVAYSLQLTPASVFPLTSRVLSPEPAPPRLGALS